MARRTTSRSRAGTKLYVLRNRKGEFTDIQSYKRAHGSDVKRRSKAETAKARGKATQSRKSGGTRRKTTSSRTPRR
jgi:hypothetical protein